MVLLLRLSPTRSYGSFGRRVGDLEKTFGFDRPSTAVGHFHFSIQALSNLFL